MASNKNRQSGKPGPKPTAPATPAFGWAVVAEFGRGGTRWSSEGPRLKAVAINLERGTGSSTGARLALLRKAIKAVPPDGSTVYFTPAGFFGCASGQGDRIKGDRGLSWPGIPELADLPRMVGELAATLPKDTMLAVGVDKDMPNRCQEQWWFHGGSNVVSPLMRCPQEKGDMGPRKFKIGDFTVLSFVCGELWDGGSGFDIKKDTKDIDVVLDLSHASVNRVWDRKARPRLRCAFQRMFRDLKSKCGAMLSYAHDVDTEAGIVRRQDNWITFKGENPFPEDGHEVIRLA